MEFNQLSVLDHNLGASNIVNQEQIDSIMFNVFDAIGNVLMDHCGPYSGYAMIPPDASNPLAAPTFTKDGINIINAIKFINPIEVQTKELLAYIGRKVERTAGDGTTSSMWVATYLLSVFRKMLSENKTITYREFTNAYDRFVVGIAAEIDKLVITPADDERDLMAGIAFHQAMTSSHGDVELSRMVSDLVGQLGRGGMQHLIFEREGVETKDRFKVIVDDSSYSTEAHIFDNKMLNSAVCTEFVDDDCDLLFFPNEIISNSMELTVLIQAIEALEPDGRGLVVVSPYHGDMLVTNKVAQLYHTLRVKGIKFAWFRIQNIHPTINDINGLCAVMGQHYARGPVEGLRRSNIKAVFRQNTLHLHNLVEYDAQGLHPDLARPGSAINLMLFAIDDYLTSVQENRVAQDFSFTPTTAKRIANTLRYSTRGHIMIGGTNYDNQAAVDVLTDVLSAARESITNGVALGGYKTLMSAARTVALNYNYGKVSLPDDRGYCLVGEIATCYDSALTEFLRKLYFENNPKSLPADATRCDISCDLISGELIEFTSTDLRKIPEHIPGSHKQTPHLVVQPKNTDIEFVKRFGEVAIKFLFTNKVIIPNSVSLKQEPPE
jgi:hypothetical protein